MPEDLIQRITSSSAPKGMKTRIIAVDGPGGAGKSTLAAQLSKRLNDAPIMPTDDFASWDNPINWWPRMIEQVLEPISKNEAAHYQRYDWDLKKMAEWRNIEPAEFLILEGVTASRDKFRPYLAFTIWVETPREERLRRGLERDGEDARDQWAEWMAEEDKYINDEQPDKRADAIVQGT